MEHNSQMQTILKRSALIGGGAVLLFSIYFSYDGFDQKMGGNANYAAIAIVLGIGLAIIFTIIEFIFNSGFGKLNLTLIVCGILAYVYSIKMNHDGITHILGMTDPLSAWVLASAMDILPESMFAWALGDSLKGDLFGNTLKSVGMVFGMIFGIQPKEDRRVNNLRDGQPRDGYKRGSDQQKGHQTNTSHGSNKSKGKDRLRFLEQSRNDGKKIYPEDAETEPKIKISRFFGEE
jgi:hypothetical protein